MKRNNIISLVSLLALACGQKSEFTKPEGYVRDHSRMMFSSPIDRYIALSDSGMPFILYLGNIGRIEKMVLVTSNVSNDNRREVCEHSIDHIRQCRISPGNIMLSEHALGSHIDSEGRTHVLPFGNYRARVLVDAEGGKFFDEVTYEWRD